MQIGEMIRAHADKQPAKSAIVYQGKKRSYATIQKEIDTYRHLMDAKARQGGLVPPLRIAINLTETDDQLLAFLAVASLGWIGVPSNDAWSKREQDAAFALSKADVLLTDKDQTARLPIWRIEELKANREDVVLPIATKTDSFYIGFTSGSTGNPKAYMRTHQSWSASFDAAKDVFGLCSEDRVSVPGSLFHSLFLFAAVHTLHMGATVYLESSFAPHQVIQTVKNEDINIIYAVPTMTQALIGVAENPIENVSAVIVSGAKWSKRQRERTKGSFPNAELIEFYGASELSFVSYLNHRKIEQKETAVGTLFPGVEMKVDQEQRLYVYSPYLFAGYVGESAPKGWLTVGDIGYLDEHNIVHVKGRTGNMLIIGGHNVYPEEVERLAKTLPFVDEAIAVGISHDYWGKQMELYIKGDGNVPDDAKRRVRVLLNNELAPVKRPRRIHFVDAYPVLASGKIDRQALVGQSNE